MRLIGLLPAALAASLIFPAGPQAAERARADVECTSTDQKLVYDCMIMLTGRKSGTAMDGVEFTVAGGYAFDADGTQCEAGESHADRGTR